MLAGPLGLAAIFDDFDELATGNLALGAALGRGVALVDISAYGTSEFLCHKKE